MGAATWGVGEGADKGREDLLLPRIAIVAATWFKAA